MGFADLPWRAMARASTSVSVHQLTKYPHSEYGAPHTPAALRCQSPMLQRPPCVLPIPAAYSARAFPHGAGVFGPNWLRAKVFATRSPFWVRVVPILPSHCVGACAACARVMRPPPTHSAVTTIKNPECRMSARTSESGVRGVIVNSRLMSYRWVRRLSCSHVSCVIFLQEKHCFSVGFPAENAGFSVEKPTEKLSLSGASRWLGA